MKREIALASLEQMRPKLLSRYLVRWCCFLGLFCFINCFVLFSCGSLYATGPSDNKAQNVFEQPVENVESLTNNTNPFPEEPIKENSVTNKPQLNNALDNKVSQKNVMLELRKLFVNTKEPTMETIPLVKQLSQEFEVYKKDIISTAGDENEPFAFRIQMLELLNAHWVDDDAKKAIIRTFKEGHPSSKTTAYAAKYLSERGVDISEKIINEFSSTDIAVKPLYIRALGQLKKNDGVNLIREELLNSVDLDSRLAAIEVLGLLPDIDSQSSQLLTSVVQVQGRLIDGKRPAMNHEIEAQRAVFSMGEIGGNNIEKLLELAADEQLTTNIRIAAVESLKNHILNKDIDIKQQLYSIEKVFSMSNSSQADKIRFKQMVHIVTNTGE